MTQNEKAAAARKRKHAIMIAILILVFILFVIPFILVIINVFKDQADITANPLALVGEHGFTFKNFPEAMKKMDFFNVFKNSLIIVSDSVLMASPPTPAVFKKDRSIPRIVLLERSPSKCVGTPQKC